MGWQHLEDVDTDDDGLTPMERAARLKRYAQKVVKLAQEGRYDPEKTALARLIGLQSAAQLEDLGDDEPAAFSPAQRRALKRLAARLRAYARRVGKHHDHGPGTKLGRLRLPHGHGRGMVRRHTAVPVSGWESDDDDEMGILPAIPAIIGAAAPLIGSLIGGGGKKSSPRPAAPAAPVMSAMPAATSSGVNLPAIGGVVADQIRAVPPPVRQQIVDGMREVMDRYKSGQQDAASLMADIRKQLGPTIKAQLQSVDKAALQRQATFEHESLKRRDARWKANAEAQKRILARLDQMEATLGTAVVGKQKRMDAAARAFGIPQRYL